MHHRIVTVLALLAGANLAAWAGALAVFHDHPRMMGMAFLAWGLGLRHAVDADHLAAIDNVTRKLMQQGQRPIAVGLFFSLGHSSIVVLASLAVALAAGAFRSRMGGLEAWGGMAGTLVSAGFLLLIAGVNLMVLRGVWRDFRHARAGGACPAPAFDAPMAGHGLLARMFRPLFALIRASWHMYPLGLLFGLGFDTASEVALLGLAATGASEALPIWSIMLFPALFTAGMALVDTADGMVMLGAYGWAFVRPMRKLFYNLTITGISVAVALLVGGIEVLGLIAPQGWNGGMADLWNSHAGTISALIIAMFVAAWGGSALIYRIGGYDRMDEGQLNR